MWNIIKNKEKFGVKSMFVALTTGFICLQLLAGTSYSDTGINSTIESLKNEQINSTSDNQTTSEAKVNVPAGGVVSNCSALNVRSGPGTEYPVIGGVSSGAELSIISKAGDWWKIKYNGGEAYVSGKYVDTNAKLASSTEVAMSGKGVVRVNTSLNVRSEPWGAIEGKLKNGDAVEVVAKAGNWYKIKYNGKYSYVYSSYVDMNGSSAKAAEAVNNIPDGSKSDSDKSDNNNNSSSASGDLQQRIVSSAGALVGSTNFRSAAVGYGNVACAQVVTTALKNAGAVNSVVLGVLSAIDMLKDKGWKEVSAPPFKPGDVVTWKTYDRSGDGVKDADTHIGIVESGTTCISNSSSQKMPRRHDVYYQPISRVLRKA